MAQTKIKGNQVDSGTLDLASSDGSVLTGVNADLLGGQNSAFHRNASNINAGILASARLSGTYTNVIAGNSNLLGGQPIGTGPLDIVALDSSSRLPAVNGSLLTNIPAPPFRGAKSRKLSNQSIPHNTTTKITFDLETYDTDNIHSNITNNTRFTVPAGVTKVIIKAYGEYSGFDLAANTTLLNWIYKNNSGIDIKNAIATGTGNIKSVSLTSYPLVTTAGDYFEFVMWQQSGIPVPITSTSWMSMEIIE